LRNFLEIPFGEEEIVKVLCSSKSFCLVMTELLKEREFFTRLGLLFSFCSNSSFSSFSLLADASRFFILPDSFPMFGYL
jgi:hypothetical protein